MGLYEKSLEFNLKSLEIDEEIYPDKKHSDLANSYGNIALIYKAMGLYEKSLEFNLKSLEIRNLSR